MIAADFSELIRDYRNFETRVLAEIRAQSKPTQLKCELQDDDSKVKLKKRKVKEDYKEIESQISNSKKRGRPAKRACTVTTQVLGKRIA